MGSGEMRNEMVPDKEEVKLFMELKTLEETMSVNEDSTYMRDYIFQKGVLKEIHFDKITDR